MSYAFTSSSRRVLCSLVPVICPPQYAHLANAIVDHMALMLGAQPVIVRRALDAGLALYDLGALPSQRKRAHKLTGAAAEAYFSSWEHGPTPLHFQVSRLLNQLMCLSCYEQPEVMRDCGYDVAPWIDEVRAKRLHVFKDAIAKQDHQLLAPDPLRPNVPNLKLQRKERI